MRISPDSFRRIAPAVHEDSIEIAGELVPITPENTLKIKQAVLAWQKDSQRTRAELAKAQAAEMSVILGGPREAGQDAVRPTGTRPGQDPNAPACRWSVRRAAWGRSP